MVIPGGAIDAILLSNFELQIGAKIVVTAYSHLNYSTKL